MKYTFKPAQKIDMQQFEQNIFEQKTFEPKTCSKKTFEHMHAFALMNNQFLSNQEINTTKPYLTSVAHQNRYATAAIRAQLALGWIYAQQSFTTQSPTTKSFYTLKAREYLSNVALQEVYKQGQECALELLRILTMT